MKKLITIIAIFFPSLTFAQTCELKLKDIRTIDSQQNFERVLIENNFQRANLEELGWKKEAEKLSKKDTLFLAYTFEGETKYTYSQQTILAFGYFPSKNKMDSGDNFYLGFVISNPEDKYSVYSMIFSEVKEKCSFDEVIHNKNGQSASFYNCPNANFRGKIGFSIVDDNGMIVINNSEPLTGEQSSVLENQLPLVVSRKNLDAIMGGFSDGDGKATGGEGDDNKAGDKGKITGDPNASGYYGAGGGGDGGNYRLGNRKALTKPKPTYDCNEEGKVYVKISVDNTGRVFAAQAGVKGSTNSANCLLTKAKEAALKTRFNSDSNAPSNQIGIIIYNFSLSD